MSIMTQVKSGCEQLAAQVNQSICEGLAELAVRSLIEEAELTPKPGLVDRNSSGAHTDMKIELMIASALSLQEPFAQMAAAASGQAPSQPLRERLALIGRAAEVRMMGVTGGINTHRGSIWALGLLISGAVIAGRDASAERIASTAAEIARYPDRHHVIEESNGIRASRMFGVSGARGEAEQGFPHVVRVALPMLKEARGRGLPEDLVRLDSLIAVMSRLDDTCILHRGGMKALRQVQQAAAELLALGGVSSCAGRASLLQLTELLAGLNVSPGGSADMLAAALFLDKLESFESYRRSE